MNSQNKQRRKAKTNMNFKTIALFVSLLSIASASDCGSRELLQADYRGTLAMTRSNFTCQRWDSQSPHGHSRTPSNYPNKGLEENYCRNPDNEPGGAWCYTTDPSRRWEYCAVPMCDPPPTYTDCGSTWVDNEFVGKSDYRGTIAKTVSGRTCQRWDSQSPHSHSRTFANYPYEGLDENYCRNPDGEGQPWCYTTDENKRWEYCDIPACDEGPPSAPAICYDYTEVFDLGPNECTGTKVYHKIRSVYNAQRRLPGAESCEGGLDRELMGLTRTTSVYDAYAALQYLCDHALEAAGVEAGESDWSTLEQQINLQEFWEGEGYLNEETGNFQQEENDFLKRGGYEKFIYIGDDPRQNDYLSTSEQSYAGGQAIDSFYANEASSYILPAPSNFNEESCPLTNAAVCCWHRDRQYFDNNGNCNQNDCARANPADNTDLCWTEEEGNIFPYPGDEIEKDLHCHGFAWANNNMPGDVNSKAKWNNLFFVSLYDHLYQRGYADSITDDPLIAGEQAMCGCVEDMNPVARADCTEAVGQASYKLYQDGVGGELVISPVPGTFEIEFQSCKGYDYVEDFDPADYEMNPNAAELTRSNNDLSAFVFRLYLEGKIDYDRVTTFEKTMIGYRDPAVNDSDTAREAACQKAYEDTFPGESYYAETL